MKKKTAETPTLQEFNPILEDLFPNNGPGLFDSDEGKQSDVRAKKALASFVKKYSILSDDQFNIIIKELLQISNKYWSDKKHDKLMSNIAFVKNDTKKLEEQLSRVADLFDTIQPWTTNAIILALNRKHSSAVGREILNKTMSDLASIKEIVASIASLPNPKKSLSCVKNACSTLWRAWERATGRKFSRSRSVASKEFVNLDPLFVQVVLQAIDSNVSVNQIVASLSDIAKAMNKKKSQSDSHLDFSSDVDG